MRRNRKQQLKSELRYHQPFIQPTTIYAAGQKINTVKQLRTSTGKLNSFFQNRRYCWFRYYLHWIYAIQYQLINTLSFTIARIERTYPKNKPVENFWKRCWIYFISGNPYRVQRNLSVADLFIFQLHSDNFHRYDIRYLCKYLI